MSKSCEDFIRKLICEPEDRMCYDQIVQHPWMSDLDFSRLQSYNPPFVPRLKSDIDTSYFD